jgi:hypothetical protein
VAQSLPLATGIHVHDALAQLMRVVQEQGQVERVFVRGVVQAVTSTYRAECAARGFQEVEHSEQVAQVIQEQACLIEGLVWGFYRTLLPWVLAEFTVEAVEREIELPVGCTCGLGDKVGSFADHDGRQCGGVGVMIRPDLVLRRKSDGVLGIADFKTSAYPSEIKEEDHLMQLVLNGVGVEKEFGEPCTHHYLIGLHKGKREADRGDTLKRQRSPLCYLYYRPQDPPFQPTPTYQAKYTRERGFGRVPVWECQFEGEGSAVEKWVMDRMSAEEVGEVVSVVGPQQRPDFLIDEVLREVVAEELDVQQKLGLLARGEGELPELFRRSWDCWEFGKPCEFLPICKKEPGWEAPLAGRYERRKPHHLAEEDAQ